MSTLPNSVPKGNKNMSRKAKAVVPPTKPPLVGVEKKPRGKGRLPVAPVKKEPPPEGKHMDDIDGWIAFFEYWRPRGGLSERDEWCYHSYLQRREKREAEAAKLREIEEDAEKAWADLAAMQAGSSDRWMQGWVDNREERDRDRRDRRM